MGNEKNIPASKKVVGKKEFSLADFKKKAGADDIPFKPTEWIKCSPAIQNSCGIPGVAIGYVNIAAGWSDSGKSTIACESAVYAQKMGILPIIFDTENNIGKTRLEIMGFDWDHDFYILVDNEYLLEQFGKKKDKNRKEAAIEDLADAIDYFLEEQERGSLPVNLLFIIDSIGTLDSLQTVTNRSADKSVNNQWNAGAYERAFKSIINNRIPNSKKINKEFTNTMLLVNKVWLDSSSPGMPVLRLKGGEGFYSASRLLLQFGGTLTHGTSKVVATAKGREIVFGVKTKINVKKNHVDGELGGISMKGDIISTPHGFISADTESINEYKKKNINYFRDVLGGDIDIDDIDTKIIENKDEFEVDQFSPNK